MELYQIQTFVIVAKEGHLTRAANQLNASQPAVSAHIKALEEELGVTLFGRTPKGMKLTPQGKEVLEYAEKLLISCDNLKYRVKEMNTTLIGDVKIGLNSDPKFLRTGELYSLFSNNYRDINLYFFQSASGKILLDIKSGVLDGGYFFGNNNQEDLETYMLRPLKLLVIGPYSWKDSFENASLAALAKLPWIGNPRFCSFNQALTELFVKKKLNVSVSLVAEHESTIKSLVAAGAGMSFMLEHEAVDAAAKGELAIWKKSSIEWWLSFAFLKKRENDPVIRTLNSLIQKIWNI